MFYFLWIKPPQKRLQFLTSGLGTLHWQPQKCTIIFYRRRGCSTESGFLPHTELAPPRMRRRQEAASQLPQKWSVQGSYPVLFPLTPAGTACYCWVQLFVFSAVNLWVPFAKKGVRTRHRRAESTRKTFRGRTQRTLHNWEWSLLKPAKWKSLTLFSI